MANFDFKKAILENKATFFSSLTEGQFSWMTQDTEQQIGSEKENTIPVYMFDNKGKYYYENNYGGYGEFGGKDYYDLVAEMNGYTKDDAYKLGGTFKDLRGIGIKLAFGDLEPKNGGPVLFPALVAEPNTFNYKTHDFTQEAENDPNQSWYDGEGEEEEDYYDYDEEDNEYLDESKIEKEKPKTKMKKSELKELIKSSIMNEVYLDIDNMEDAPESEVDFLAEVDAILAEADKIKEGVWSVVPARIPEFIKAIEDIKEEYYGIVGSDDVYNGLDAAISAAEELLMNTAEINEADEEVAVDDTEVAVDGEENIDVDTTVEVDPNVKAVQDALTQAQAAAQKLGDPKLTDQIGNTITFFTRAHVVDKGAVAEADEMEEGKKEYYKDAEADDAEHIKALEKDMEDDKKSSMNESMFPLLKRILK